MPPRSTLPFPAAPSGSARRPAAPDVAVAALPLFARLRDALTAARKPDRWGVPRLFFFHPDPAARMAGLNPAARPDPLPADVRDLLDDAVSLLTSSAEVRRAGRAVPGLTASAKAWAGESRRARELADLLDLADDEVVRAVHPAVGAGFRLRVRGVSDLGQFQVLLTDAVTGSPARGLLPGPRPADTVLSAYREGAPDADESPVAEPRFQLFRPSALRPDGSLPAGFAGAGDWLWPTQPLASVPRIDGERVVLLGEPVVRGGWAAERRLPRVSGELELLEVMSATMVGDWLAERTGRGEQPVPAQRRAG